MSKHFTRIAFTDSVKLAQARYGTRDAYARMEQTGAPIRMGARERQFIGARDTFYMATVGENGWPYVQHRGGEMGFLKVLDETRLGYADFRGNGQYISTGNIESGARVALILMDYPNRLRLKVWAEADIVEADSDEVLLQALRGAQTSAAVERLVTLEVQAFDWNCPRHITPRYTLDEIEQLVGE